MTDYPSTKEVSRANREFYRAFEACSMDAMRAVWLDDPQIKCVHPAGEVLVGLERVMASWAAIFGSAEGIRFELLDLMIEVVGELGWVTLLERIHMGAAPPSLTACTNLFLRRDGRWQMLLHHASPISRRFFRDA